MRFPVGGTESADLQKLKGMKSVFGNHKGQLLLETLWILFLVVGLLVTFEIIFRQGLLALQKGL